MRLARGGRRSGRRASSWRGAHQRARGRDRVASSATTHQQSPSDETEGKPRAARTGQHWRIMAPVSVRMTGALRWALGWGLASGAATAQRL